MSRSSSSSNSETWPSVDDVKSLNTDELNAIIDAIVQRTDSLDNRIKNLNGNCGLIFTAKNIDSKCKVGMMVAYDPSDGIYIPAKPAFSEELRPDGSMVPDYSSYVVGVLVELTNGIGTIVAYGWTTDAALIASIVGTQAAAGTYYLSETTPGKLTAGTESGTLNIPIYCCTLVRDVYNQDTLLINPKAPEYTGHSHGGVKLDEKDGWTTTSDNKPVYTSTSDMFLSLINSYNGHNLTLTNDGAVLADDLWLVDKDNKTIILTAANTLTASDNYVLHGIMALAGKDPLVHQVTVEGSGVMTANTAYGDVVISTDFLAKGEEYGGKAISRISDTGVISCPVVHAIEAGPGIVISPAIDEAKKDKTGCFVISSAAVCENQIDMQISNLDGVLFGTDTYKVCYVFPAGVTSAMYGSFRVPHFEDGSFQAKLNLLIMGTTAETISADVTVIPMPTAAASSSIPKKLEVSKYTSNNTYSLGTATIDSVFSDALITCKLSATPKDNPIQLIAASIELVTPETVDATA